MVGWTTSPLDSLCTVFGDGDWIESKDQAPDGVRLIQTGNIGEGEFKDRAEKARFISLDTFKRLRCTEIFSDDCLISRLPDPVGRACLIPETAERLITAVDCTIVRFDQSKMLPHYFVYYTQAASYLAAVEREATGTTRKRISRARLGQVSIPLAPLAEQRRIVAILDEAFEAIATAQANTKKNLQNARELFASHLESLLSQGGDGWLEAPIVDCFKVRSGDFLPAKSMVSGGEVPVYGGNGIAGLHDVSNLSGDQIVIGRVGAKCGNVRHVCGDIWLTDNAFHISKYLRPFNPAFLTRVLNLKNLRQTANQAAQPVISYTTIKDVVLSFPVDTAMQGVIAARLDELEEHVERINAVYERKLSALDELKKSLLHQVFTGALTAKSTDKQLAEVA